MAKPNIKWDPAKNEWLKASRGVSFEAVVAAFEADTIIDDVEHPHRPNQCIVIVELNGYLCAVPYVLQEGIVFLKTIYPDRRLKDKYREES
jgi:uncharacterized DUF497 family protein